MKITPVEYKVLVRPIPVEETDEVIKAAKAAGIVIRDEDRSREQAAQIKAELLAVGGDAFKDWNHDARLPRVGDTVFISKYAGYIVRDGEVEMRLINDKDICAVVEG